MATAAAQAPAAPTATEPVQRSLTRRSACPQPEAQQIGTPAPSLSGNSPEAHSARRAPPNEAETNLRATGPAFSESMLSSARLPVVSGCEAGRAPFCASSNDAQRAATNRANSAHSTGPRTESGKQRSSQNALSHGLTARTALLPTEDPEAYQRHIQQFLDEYAPANATETQLVHEIANTAWRLNRIPFLEADLLSQNPSPQALIPQLATLGLHGARLSRQFQKAVDQLRDIQDERRRLERRLLNEAAELLIRHQRKGLHSDPAGLFPEQAHGRPVPLCAVKHAGFVFSKEQIERHAQHLIRQNPAYYAPTPRLQTAPTPQAHPAPAAF